MGELHKIHQCISVFYELQHVKTNVIENIVPIVIALKRKLEEMKSPLIDDLMSYLREIMKDYKSEVKEILSADKQLAAEIQFDLKKWEEEQAEQMANIKRQQEEMVSRSLFIPSRPYLCCIISESLQI